MKNSLWRGVGGAGRLLVIACGIGLANWCGAQDNVWTGTASGKWQDASWSLGVLPATEWKNYPVRYYRARMMP